MNKLFFYGLALLLYTLTLASYAASSLDSIAAIVNHEVITRAQVDAQLTTVKQQLRQRNMPMPDNATLQHQVLNLLINQSLQLQAAKRLDIKADDKEVNESLARIASSQHVTPAQILQSLQAHGINKANFMANLRKQIIIEKVQKQFVASHIKVSEEEVDSALKEAKREIAKQKEWQYHLENIVLPLPPQPSPEVINRAAQQAQEIMAEIGRGASFNKLALSHSIGQTALLGGDMGWKTLAELSPAYAEQISKLPINQVLGPVRTPNGIEIIKLVGKRAVKLSQAVKSSALRTRVREAVFQRKFAEKLQIWLEQLRAATYIKIMK